MIGLNKLVKKLDKRLSKTRTSTKKLKILPELSKFPQPSNAPAWAVKQDTTRYYSIKFGKYISLIVGAKIVELNFLCLIFWPSHSYNT